MTPGDLAAAAARLDGAALWATSGAMALTGEPDGPTLGIDAPVAALVHAAGDVLVVRALHQNRDTAGGFHVLDAAPHLAARLGQRLPAFPRDRSGQVLQIGFEQLL